jgi:hypothetical protein
MDRRSEINKTETQSQVSNKDKSDLPFNRRNDNDFKYLDIGLVSLIARQRKNYEQIKLVI